MRLRRLNQLSPEPVRTGAFHESRILVAGLAVVRVYRRHQPEEDARAGRRPGNCRERCGRSGGRELERHGHAAVRNAFRSVLRAGGRWSRHTHRRERSIVRAQRRTGLELAGVPAGWRGVSGHGMSVARGVEQTEIYLATLRDGRAVDPVLLMKNATAARYTPAGGGRLLFVRNDNLYAQTLNRSARTLEGEPQLIQQRVASSPAFRVAHFSVSRTGVVVWRPGTAGLSQVTIFDRQGREIGTAGSPTVVQTLRLAPDETRLLIGFNQTARLLEPGRPGQQQLEQGALDTLWSSDGSKLLDGIPTDEEKPPRGGTSRDRRRGGSRTGEGDRNGAS